MTREEILREFKGVEGINEAKKIYKQLAKKLHPDYNTPKCQDNFF